MFCPSCGKEISNNEKTCPYCRNNVNGGNSNQGNGANGGNIGNAENAYDGVSYAEYPASTPAAESVKIRSGKKVPTVLVIFVVVIGMAVCGVAGVFFYKNVIEPDMAYDDFEETEEKSEKESEDKEQEKEETAEDSSKDEKDEDEVKEENPEEEKTEDEASDEDDVALNFTRLSTYDKSYSYSSMSGIHSSEEADGAVANDLASFIGTYNNRWIDFVNYEDTALYDYLRSGTHAYDVAEEYEHKNIRETLDTMEVYDVRQNDNIYYVWTHEELTVYDENGSVASEKEYYWVYQIVKDSRGYYVETYERDPYYKSLGKTD